MITQRDNRRLAVASLNALLFRVDLVPDVHDMFAVERPGTSDGERERVTRAQFDALRRETNVFADTYAVVSDIDSRLDGRRMSGTFVTGNFFQVVRVNAAIGRALTPAEDERRPKADVVVAWEQLAGLRHADDGEVLPAQRDLAADNRSPGPASAPRRMCRWRRPPG